MDVKQAILQRRNYRSLEPIEITDALINDLAKSVQLAPSCFNNQPWRFSFVYEPPLLKKLHSALSKGNEWGYSGSMIIVITSKKDYDCILKNREYYLFDTGIATAFLLLRATELGLVAHPIAGYSEKQVKEFLDIPEDMTVITLVVVGKHSKTISTHLSEKQIETEKQRPERLSLAKFAFKNIFQKEQ
jgi:nitroreductase